MIKDLLHIVVLLLAVQTFAQEKPDGKEKKWKEEKEYLDYLKKEGYEGPEDWYGSRPSDIYEDEVSYGPGSRYSGRRGSGAYGLRYSPQSIQRDRNQRYQGFDRGGGDGDLQFDPSVERPEDFEAPDIDAPEINPPDIDAPDVSTPSVSSSVWKILLFVLLAIVLLLIVYFIVKNKKPANKRVVVDVENEWNPEVISKTELELKLEAAMESGDYRECVRIYFTFILKELIRKGWIDWQREKTNHHYVMEMGQHSNALAFMECVRIYDLVWYGEYDIDEEVFEMLRPTLEHYYKSLDPVDE